MRVCVCMCVCWGRLNDVGVYAAIFNVLHMPATQCPTGMNVLGMPLGVQVVGARGRDVVTIAVACQLEKLLGGWVPPFTASATAAAGAR